MNLATQLPHTVDEFRARRKTKPSRSLKDQIEELHLELYKDPDYVALLDAISNEKAVTGSMTIDDVLACQMIQALADKRGKKDVTELKLAVLVKLLKSVINRYEGCSRRERRKMNGPSA
jgi:hypothetical protein